MKSGPLATDPAATVVGLRGQEVPPPVLSEEAAGVVAILEKALAAARMGHYEGIGLVMVAKANHPDIDTHREWRTTPGTPPTRLAAALQFLICDLAGAG